MVSFWHVVEKRSYNGLVSSYRQLARSTIRDVRLHLNPGEAVSSVVIPALFVEPMAVALASTRSSPEVAEHGVGTASMVSGGFK